MPPKEVVDSLIEEAKLLGKPEKKSDGTLTFNFFLESSKLVTKYTLRQTKDGLAEHAVKRRESLKDNDEQKFQELILEVSNWEQLTHSLIQSNLYQFLKVPKDVFEKTLKTYLMDPQKRTVYEEEMQNLRDEVRSRPPRELTRDEALNAVRLLEQAKLDAQKRMYDYVREQRIQHSMINAVIKVEKLKADDRFFNETGIEEEDVEPSIKALKLEDDEEYKQIIEEFKKKSEEFLKNKQEEARLLMQQAKARQQQQEAQKGQVAGAEHAHPSQPASQVPSEATEAKKEDKTEEKKAEPTKQEQTAGADPMGGLGSGSNIW